MVKVIPLTNLQMGNHQAFVGKDKKEGEVVTLRNNGATGELANTTGYFLSFPVKDLGIVERLIGDLRVAVGAMSYDEIEAEEARVKEMDEQVTAVWKDLQDDLKAMNVLRDIRDQNPADPQQTLSLNNIDSYQALHKIGVIDCLNKDPDSGEILHWSASANDYFFTELGLHIEGLLRDKDGIARKNAA